MDVREVSSNYLTSIDETSMIGWGRDWPLFVAHNYYETFQGVSRGICGTITLAGNIGLGKLLELFDLHNLNDSFQFHQVCVELFSPGSGFT